MNYGSCLLRSIQYAGTGAASREGQSSISISRESIGYEAAKVKLIVFMKSRKNGNRREKVYDMQCVSVSRT
jgi:hypothetical protein